MGSNVRWLKYDFIDGVLDYAEHARFSSDGYSVTLEIKDGGYGDFDRTVNGIIIDPGGVSTSSTSGSSDATGGDNAEGYSTESSGGGGCFVGTAFGSFKL
jgi:hypothetical protein